MMLSLDSDYEQLRYKHDDLQRTIEKSVLSPVSREESDMKYYTISCHFHMTPERGSLEEGAITEASCSYFSLVFLVKNLLCTE